MRLRQLVLFAPVAGLLAAVALLCAAPGADAASSFTRLYFGVRDFEIDVKPHGRKVHVTIYSVGGNLISTYTVRADKFNRRGVDARLPGFGRFRLKFKPESKRGRPNHIAPECSGKPGRRIRGTMKVKFRFRDGTGAQQVGVNEKFRTRGTFYYNHGKVECPWDEGESLFDHIDTSGLAALTAENQSLQRSFLAVRNAYVLAPDGFAVAGEFVKKNGVRVVRLGFSELDATTFPVASGFGSASFTGFSPFSGSAGFVRTGPESGSWEGDLAVWLIGRPELPMAGPGFTANVGWWDDVVGGTPVLDVLESRAGDRAREAVREFMREALG